MVEEPEKIMARIVGPPAYLELEGVVGAPIVVAHHCAVHPENRVSFCPVSEQSQAKDYMSGRGTCAWCANEPTSLIGRHGVDEWLPEMSNK